VADFGLSKRKESSYTYTKLMMDWGTTWWMTLEVFGDSEDHVGTSGQVNWVYYYPFKGDIYSLGVACYEILTRCAPFYNFKLKKLQKRIKDALRPDIPEECPWTTVHLGLDLLSSQPCTGFISWHLWHFGIYVPFMFITLDKNVHWFQILMAAKSPSGVEMVLKGLDIQLEISTLDSLGKAIYDDKFVFSLMVQEELTFLSCLLICCCQVWNICNFSIKLSLNSIQVDFVCMYGEILSTYEDIW
jgi:serine/threonine protein kinase